MEIVLYHIVATFLVQNPRRTVQGFVKDPETLKFVRDPETRVAKNNNKETTRTIARAVCKKLQLSTENRLQTKLLRCTSTSEGILAFPGDWNTATALYCFASAQQQQNWPGDWELNKAREGCHKKEKQTIQPFVDDELLPKFPSSCKGWQKMTHHTTLFWQTVPGLSYVIAGYSYVRVGWSRDESRPFPSKRHKAKFVRDWLCTAIFAVRKEPRSLRRYQRSKQYRYRWSRRLVQTGYKRRILTRHCPSGCYADVDRWRRLNLAT